MTEGFFCALIELWVALILGNLNCFFYFLNKAHFFLWGYHNLSHALMMKHPGCWLLLIVQLNNYRHVVLQKSQMRTPGSWISRCGCWNRPIVCLHAGWGLGQAVPSFQDFKLKTGKKREKEAVVWSGSRRISCLQGVPSYKRKEMPWQERERGLRYFMNSDPEPAYCSIHYLYY